MSDVTVIGSGTMGRAFVRRLAEAGHQTTVWNRTEETARALVGSRVRPTGTAADAVEASPLAVMCVADHEVTHAILTDVAERLDGRTVLSISFATPDEAAATRELVESAGGRFLELAVMAYPRDIGTEAAKLLVSGDHGAFAQHRETLAALGTVTHIAEAPGVAFAAEMAALLPYMPIAASLMQGIRICELHGLSVERFADTVLRVLPPAIAALLDRIASGEDTADPANVEASVEVWAEGVAEYRAYLDALGLDTGMYDALQRVFAAAVAAGHAEHDWTAIRQFTGDRQGAEGEDPATT